MHRTAQKKLSTDGQVLVAVYKGSILDELQELVYPYKCTGVEDDSWTFGIMLKKGISVWEAHSLGTQTSLEEPNGK